MLIFKDTLRFELKKQQQNVEESKNIRQRQFRGKLYLLLLGTTALSLAMFIPSAEALDTSYFMSNYVWNPNDENVGGGCDFDDMTETCSISCSSGSCYTQDED
ncbi:putative serine/threonine protein kinase IRE [Camellia lanceoleosa]|uniref:Serine/threonine protein kinase IRE n=1 Tax=Camellia lanceoleosa TaxID=1840588 RepID=A0ACC0IH71_9ERIC|nr:putative serine/threonine protein kinase IRE [Camellia lanceoleosa]